MAINNLAKVDAQDSLALDDCIKKTRSALGPSQIVDLHGGKDKVSILIYTRLIISRRNRLVPCPQNNQFCKWTFTDYVCNVHDVREFIKSNVRNQTMTTLAGYFDLLRSETAIKEISDNLDLDRSSIFDALDTLNARNAQDIMNLLRIMSL